MNRTALAAATAVVLLLLTGCTAGNQATSSDTPSASETTDAAAPLVAATGQASQPGTQRNDSAFVAMVRSTLRAENVIPDATDEQLVTAGLKACELHASGTVAEDISVIDGEERTYGYYLDSFKIYQAAAASLC